MLGPKMKLYSGKMSKYQYLVSKASLYIDPSIGLCRLDTPSIAIVRTATSTGA